MEIFVTWWPCNESWLYAAGVKEIGTGMNELLNESHLYQLHLHKFLCFFFPLQDEDKAKGGISKTRYQELYAQFIGCPEGEVQGAYLFGPLQVYDWTRAVLILLKSIFRGCPATFLSDYIHLQCSCINVCIWDWWTRYTFVIVQLFILWWNLK